MISWFTCVIRNQTSCWNLSKSCITQPLASVWSISALTLCLSSHVRLCSHIWYESFRLYNANFLSPSASLLQLFHYSFIWCVMKRSDNTLSENAAHQGQVSSMSSQWRGYISHECTPTRVRTGHSWVCYGIMHKSILAWLKKVPFMWETKSLTYLRHCYSTHTYTGLKNR